MAEDPAPPLVPDPEGFAVGDRVTVEAEIRRVDEESCQVRFESGYGLLQYVWVKFKHVFRPGQ